MCCGFFFFQENHRGYLIYEWKHFSTFLSIEMNSFLKCGSTRFQPMILTIIIFPFAKDEQWKCFMIQVPDCFSFTFSFSEFENTKVIPFEE